MSSNSLIGLVQSIRRRLIRRRDPEWMIQDAVARTQRIYEKHRVRNVELRMQIGTLRVNLRNELESALKNAALASAAKEREDNSEMAKLAKAATVHRRKTWSIRDQLVPLEQLYESRLTVEEHIFHTARTRLAVRMTEIEREQFSQYYKDLDARIVPLRSSMTEVLQLQAQTAERIGALLPPEAANANPNPQTQRPRSRRPRLRKR